MDFNWLKKFKRIYTNFQLKQFAIDGIFLVKNGVRIYFSQKIVQAKFLNWMLSSADQPHIYFFGCFLFIFRLHVGGWLWVPLILTLSTIPQFFV